jgi:hypothetical protein
VFTLMIISVSVLAPITVNHCCVLLLAKVAQLCLLWSLSAIVLSAACRTLFIVSFNLDHTLW